MRPVPESNVFIPGIRMEHPTEVPLVEGAVPQEHLFAALTALGMFSKPAEPEAEAAPAAEAEVVEAAPEAPAAEPEAEAPAAEAAPAEPAAEAEAPAAEAPAAAEPAPSWSSAMTKTELLAIAAQLGLSVTSSNTKAEILAALDATKQ